MQQNADIFKATVEWVNFKPINGTKYHLKHSKGGKQQKYDETNKYEL